MVNKSRQAAVRRVRLRPLALVVGLASTALLGLGTTGTLSAFTATITNSTSTVATGSLTMQQTDDSSTPSANCSSTQGANNAYASCTASNNYGGTAAPLTPGAAKTTIIRISNPGNTAASAFTLTPSACAQSGTGSATDLCSRINLDLTCAPSTTGTYVSVFSGSLTAFNSGGLVDVKSKGSGSPCLPPAGGASYVSFRFVVTLASGADNTYQGLTASQPMTWQFTGA